MNSQSPESRLRLAEEALLKNGFKKLDDVWVAPSKPIALSDAQIAATYRVNGLDVVRTVRAILAAATQPADADKRDAELWRAFIGSARIKPQGSVGLEPDTDPNGKPYSGYAHMGLEIWTKYDRDFSPELLAKMDKDTELGRRWLTAYAVIAASTRVPK